MNSPRYRHGWGRARAGEPRGQGAEAGATTAEAGDGGGGTAGERPWVREHLVYERSDVFQMWRLNNANAGARATTRDTPRKTISPDETPNMCDCKAGHDGMGEGG